MTTLDQKHPQHRSTAEAAPADESERSSSG